MVRTVAAPGVVEWRLQICMANAGIRFARDLHRRLVEALGEESVPSEAQVSRLLRSPPERLNLHTLAGLCLVLDCEPGDLLSYRPTAPSSPSRKDRAR
jgi:DNA-binding Xre family transcriptional regulator